MIVQIVLCAWAGSFPYSLLVCRYLSGTCKDRRESTGLSDVMDCRHASRGRALPSVVDDLAAFFLLADYWWYDEVLLLICIVYSMRAKDFESFWPQLQVWKVASSVVLEELLYQDVTLKTHDEFETARDS